MSAVTASKVKTFKVLYHFQAASDRELSVKKGNLVVAQGLEERGWLNVKPLRGPSPSQGYVPVAYLAPATVIARPAALQPTAAGSSLTAGPADAIVRSAESAAVEHAECGICYEAMISRKPACYLVRADDRRSCRHYFHRACVDRTAYGKARSVCSICNAPFVSAKDVPDFEVDPEGFFESVDFDHNFKLNKGEVISILKALVDLDWREVEKNVEQFWAKWDHNADGTISFKEMMHPRTGLIQYVRMAYPLPDDSERSYPKLTMKTAKDFFHYWDEDKSGTLSVDEVVRAIVKSFHKGDTGEAENIKMVLESMWHTVDHDGSGVIEEDEFCKGGGLAEILLLNYSLASS